MAVAENATTDVFTLNMAKATSALSNFSVTPAPTPEDTQTCRTSILPDENKNQEASGTAGKGAYHYNTRMTDEELLRQEEENIYKGIPLDWAKVQVSFLNARRKKGLRYKRDRLLFYSGILKEAKAAKKEEKEKAKKALLS
ncbi:hypothetical protein CkaCkLH20_04342 [Colletotrichum karsti]|uniref:Uncharacterized protein n=1 Tax=Colletotrichum karsti TaxID=1095194 RepID=A0A9P6I982_9PEZI|nr:uncharacterized protein CkaCkLH20_04342 [Colletotrichum karsti]KAF9878304.1 hypothetical protein CkaCkLH20_04342 [Colletotrichum karsti]